jgi:hypothetical protein
MAITQAMCSSFKAELLLGVHDFRAGSGDTFKLALYTSSATLDANTTAYTSSNEVTGANYTAGGNVLTSTGVSVANTSASSGVGFADFDDLTFSDVTVTARGALIYNTTPSANGISNNVLVNPAVVVLDFGADKTSTDGDFTVIFPLADATNAIIKVA